MQFDAAIQEALDAAADLIDSASIETELLRILRPQDIEEVMREKQACAQHYAKMLKKLDRRRELFADLPDRRKDEIRVTSDWVKLIVSENARLLRASAEASEKLLRAIKEAAESEYGEPVGRYGADGVLRPRARMDSTVRVSLGLDENA